MKHLPLNPQIFIDNRKRFIKEMKPNSIAVFNSNDEVPSNGDALYRFQQNSDLYWLCGVEQEDTMVVLFPDNPDPKYKEVLVLVRPNEMKEKWDGKRLRADEAKKLTGIDTIVWLDSLDALLQSWIHLADNIYLNTNENDRKGTLLETRDYRYAKEIMQRLLAIAGLTWKAAFRFRLFLVLAVLLLASGVALPLLIKDDGTARGELIPIFVSAKAQVSASSAMRLSVGR